MAYGVVMKCILSALLICQTAVASVIEIYPGYLTKIHCDGRLLVSAIGNDSLVRLEALPRELGCGAILKPKAQKGRTNLFLETTAGTVSRVIEITPSKMPTNFELQLHPEDSQ